MRRRIALMALVAVMTACGESGSNEASPAPPVPPPTAPAPADSSEEQTPIGPRFEPGEVILDAASVGEAPAIDTGVADGAAIVLPDGRLRLYFNGLASSPGISSAVSRDGLHFTIEPGVRIGDAATHPYAVAINGGYRLYYRPAGRGAECIHSAFSTDGLSFTPEPGARMTVAQAGFGPDDFCAGVAVTEVDDGWRMWVSTNRSRPGPRPSEQSMKSAVSQDGLRWTMEEGIRLGDGSAVPKAPNEEFASAEHPSVITDDDGSLTLYWGNRSPRKGVPPPNGPALYRGVSRDGGLTFDAIERLGLDALDSSVVEFQGKSYLYYGNHSEEDGGTLLVSVGEEQ